MFNLKKTTVYLVATCVFVSTFASISEAQAALLTAATLDQTYLQLVQNLSQSKTAAEKLTLVRATQARVRLDKIQHRNQAGEDDLFWRAEDLEGHLITMMSAQCGEIETSIRAGAQGMRVGAEGFVNKDTQEALKLASAFCGK